MQKDAVLNVHGVVTGRHNYGVKRGLSRTPWACDPRTDGVCPMAHGAVAAKLTGGTGNANTAVRKVHIRGASVQEECHGCRHGAPGRATQKGESVGTPVASS